MTSDYSYFLTSLVSKMTSLKYLKNNHIINTTTRIFRISVFIFDDLSVLIKYLGCQFARFEWLPTRRCQHHSLPTGQPHQPPGGGSHKRLGYATSQQWTNTAWLNERPDRKSKLRHFYPYFLAPDWNQNKLKVLSWITKKVTGSIFRKLGADSCEGKLEVK